MINLLKYKSKIFLLFIAMLLLTGCVSIPKSIQGHAINPDVTYRKIMLNSHDFIDQEVRLGGRIIKIDVQKDKTRLEIANIALDSSAKPILGQASNGRFIAEINQFIDPINFNDCCTKANFVTVTGLVKGVEAGKIGKAPYQFLVIKVTGLHQWKLREQYYYPYSTPMWDQRLYHGYPFFWPDPMWGGYGPIQKQTILTE